MKGINTTTGNNFTENHFIASAQGKTRRNGESLSPRLRKSLVEASRATFLDISSCRFLPMREYRIDLTESSAVTPRD
jgi:hypothetical protein